MFRQFHARMVRLLGQIARDRRAASAVEYGLVLALACLGLFVVIQQLGESVRATYSTLSNEVKAANTGP
jgi:Flp pilus assembly pilin Flp